MPNPLILNTVRLSPFVLSPKILATLMVPPVTPPPAVATPLVINPAILAPMTVAAPAVLFSPAALQVKLNPGVLNLIGEPPPAGYERQAATLPIADVTAIAETTVFVSADGAHNWYLPHYRLRTLSAARYDIAVTTTPDGRFRIAAGLDRTAPDGATLPAGAEELPHTVEAWLTFTNAKGLVQNIAFVELLRDANQRLTGLAAPFDLDLLSAVVPAVQRSGARLMLRRKIQIAAPMVDATGGNLLIDQRFKIMRRPVTLDSTTLRIAPMARFNRAALTDRMVAAPQIEQPPPSRYHDVDQTFEQAIDPDPLLLDPQLHAYFAAGVGGATTSTTEPLRRLSIPWHSEGTTRQHPYFQDSDDPTLFYYLPDTYRLGRTGHTPFLPEMVVRMTAPDDTSAGAQATIDYIARPTTNPARLEAALTLLTPEIPAVSAAAGTRPRLVPMPAKALLRMALPGAAGVELHEFPDITIDIANGFRQALTVPLTQFRQLFAAAFSADATSLFSGEVLVDTRLPSPESVPVDIRFAHTVGPLLDSVETPGTGDIVVVRLRNCTESTLHIRALPLYMVRGAAMVAGHADGLDLSTPLDLASGAALDLTVQPQTPLDGTGAIDVVFDLDAIDVLAKPEQILPVVSDSSVPADYVREIHVMALALTFAGQPAATPPIPPVELIHIEFETGDAVDLTPDMREAMGHVRQPLANLLLHQDVRAEFRFRQLVVYRNGDQFVDADWRTSTSELLVLPMKGV
ncbi:MAG: hypothetical protein H7245_05850 [Candidatus Saccharibacteria bacterium]|nr:hypothetical protein [Pseudorhodobacter sp.]